MFGVEFSLLLVDDFSKMVLFNCDGELNPFEMVLLRDFRGIGCVNYGIFELGLVDILYFL